MTYFNALIENWRAKVGFIKITIRLREEIYFVDVILYGQCEDDEALARTIGVFSFVERIVTMAKV